MGHKKTYWWNYLGQIGTILFFIALFVPGKIWPHPKDVVATAILVGVGVIFIAINGFMRAKDKS